MERDTGHSNHRGEPGDRSHPPGNRLLPEGLSHVTDSPELAVDYIDGGLSADAAGSVKAHLETCAECREALAEQERIVTMIRSSPQMEPPEEVWPRVTRGLTAEQKGKAEDPEAHEKSLWTRLRRTWKVQTVLPAAAGLLFLGLALGVFAQDRSLNKSEQATEVEEDTTRAMSAQEPTTTLGLESTETTSAAGLSPAESAESAESADSAGPLYGAAADSFALPPPLPRDLWLEGPTYAVTVAPTDLTAATDYLRGEGLEVRVPGGEEEQEAMEDQQAIVDTIARNSNAYQHMIRNENGGFDPAPPETSQEPRKEFAAEDRLLLIITFPSETIPSETVSPETGSGD